MNNWTDNKYTRRKVVGVNSKPFWSVYTGLEECLDPQNPSTSVYNPISIQSVIPKMPYTKQFGGEHYKLFFGLLFSFWAITLNGQGTVIQPINCDVDLTIDVQHPTCQGTDNGSILVSSNAANDDITIDWLNTPVPVEGTVQNLSPGLYFIEIATSNCVDTLKIELAYENPIIAPPLEVVFCDPGGVINFLDGVTGGSGEYQVTEIIRIGEGTDSACDICPTEIEITETTVVGIRIEDGNGCMTRRSVYAKVLDPIQIERVDSIPDKCEGDGQIQLVNITGGGGEYKFSINGEPAQQDGNFIQLQGGEEYKIQIRDQYGCTLERKVVVPSEPYIRPAVDYSVEPPSCFGATDAELRVLTAGSTDLVGFAISNTTDATPVNSTFTNLRAGRYEVFARFGETCALKLDQEAVIDQPAELTLEATTADASCDGNGDGEVLLLSGGGNANFTYRLDNSITTQTSNVFTGLEAGEYMAFVEDEKGCQDSVNFVVQNAAAPPLYIDLTPTCPGDSSGIVIIESGKLFNGSLFYSVDSINWFRGDTITTTWPAGDFTVYVLKVPGNCIYTVDTTMAEVEAPVLELSLTPVTCPGGQDGALAFTVEGGDESTYSYSLDGETYTPDTSYVNLSAGSYTLYVRDELACIFAYGFELEEPDPPTISPLSSGVSCFDGNDGEVVVQISGGLGPFLYAMDTPSFQSDSIFTDLQAGEHLLLVQDSLACLFETDISIAEPDPILVDLEVIPETCQNLNGVIALQPFGGEAPYEYAWNTGDSTWLVGNLSAGIYTVTITDTNACTVIESATVDDLAGPIVLGDVDHSHCYGSSSGKIDLTVIGGSGELVYAWSNGTYLEDPDSLMAGSYIVTVVDQKLCATTKAFTLFEPDPIQLSYQSGQYDSFWFINLQVAGGVGPYRYSWSNGEESEDLFNLLPGLYEVVVTDANDCQETLLIDIQLTSSEEPTIADLLAVYPNPTHHWLTLEWTGVSSYSVSLFDLQGRVLIPQQIQGISTELDLSPFPAGLYLLKVQSSQGLVTRKIIKQ